MTRPVQMALDGFDTAGDVALDVPGLECHHPFISPDEEQRLLEIVDASEWQLDLSRRVQHYGWRYDYTARTVTVDQHLGPLPAWLQTLARRITESTLMELADQVIVNEYEPGQGIARHTDCRPCFGPTVAMVSLGSDIQMDFESPTGDHLVPLLVPRRSLIVLTGEARTHWKHGIARRRSDRRFGLTRARRVSLTFRRVIVSHEREPTGS